MGFRLRKSVSFGKGARVNFSKSGMSFSAGIPGFSINTGRRGTYLNTGIPGTGLYSRTKIGGKSSSKSSRQSTAHSSRRPPAISPERQRALDVLRSHRTGSQANGYATFVSVSISKADGNVSFLFPDTEEEIIDPEIVKVIKSLPEYKEALPKIKEEQQRIWSTIKNDTENATNDFINIHTLAPEVFSYQEIRESLDLLALEVYERRAFYRPQPTQQEIEAQLWREAQERVKAIFSERKKQEEYYYANYQRFWQNYMNQWAAEKELFEQQENEIETAQNEAYRNEYYATKNRLMRKLLNDSNVIEGDIEAWLSTLTLPAEMSAQIEYNSSSATLFVDLDLPEIEDIPATSTTVLKSGQVKIKDKPQKQVRKEYARCIFGLAIFLAACFFDINANINSVVISGYTQRRNQDGDVRDDYIYSVKILRSALAHKNVSDPEEFFLSCENRMKLSQTYMFKPIDPFDFDKDGR